MDPQTFRIALSIVIMLEARWLQTERLIPGRDRTASRPAQTPGPRGIGAEIPVHSSTRVQNAWRYTLPSQSGRVQGTDKRIF